MLESNICVPKASKLIERKEPITTKNKTLKRLVNTTSKSALSRNFESAKTYLAGDMISFRGRLTAKMKA